MKTKNLILRSFLAAAAYAICLCLLALCGTGYVTWAAESSDQDSLKEVTLLLDWTPNTNHTGIYAAQELGYYEEAGLKVNIQVPNESTATQLVGVGKAEFGISNTDDVLHAVSLDDPMPIISIAAVIQHNTSGFVSLKDRQITSPAEWAGKTYGGYGGTTEEQIIRYIAQEYGADPDSIRFIMLGNSDVLTSLQNEIDFMWVFEAAELIGLDLEGADYQYLPVRDYGDAFDYYTPVLIANTDVCAQDPDMVKAFLAATARGYEYAAAQPEAAADILLKAVPELNEDLVRQGQAYLAERYAQDAPQWGWQEEAVWEQYSEFLYENGLIDNEVVTGTAFTTEYLPQPQNEK